ncbi:malectin domain-containing carbohydrate-binding protein [Salinigranum halophilum]|uniref:malectin domain-containing carbohydrate-binding protein n=1 Tax=Salinigranum halophilum TaxID=2565931 RepID=UPI00115CFF5D|nr:malectin domain-containing carbohydrate-binding protein [Salinigranum halophilum]
MMGVWKSGWDLVQRGAVLGLIMIVVLSPIVGPVSLTGSATAAPGDVLYRINAGGGTVGSIDGKSDWAGGTSQYATGGQTSSSYDGTVTLDGSVANGTPTEVFQSERYGDQQWTFSSGIQSGETYEVRLYFAEVYFGVSEGGAEGSRVFDVLLEDQPVIDDYDIIADVGTETGVMKSFTVTPTDSAINISLSSEVDNAKISAIEIVEAEPQSNTMGTLGTVDFGDVVVNQSGSETVQLTNLGNDTDPSITLDDVSITGRNASEFSAEEPADVSLAPGESTTVNVTFSPSDTQAKRATLVVNHSGSNSPVTVDLSGDGVPAATVGFGISGLGVEPFNPTSLDFGPDGRLYVSQQNGKITAFEITRNGTNDYQVVDTEVITTVQELPNYNDDGSYNPNVNKRQVTGLLVEGNASNPVIYAASSDPRIGAGESGGDSGLDTNSGVISRLTKTDSGWDHDMLVRGLPRSEENHATNGIQYEAETNTLYVASGGNTNKGAPSANFAFTPEYALSAAILSVDLDQIEGMAEKDANHTNATYLYDLPTLQGTATPFGGQNGTNMAMWVSDSPVDVYSPGYRNSYDIALNEDNQLYATDNGANPGWGGIVVDEGPQGVCTNEPNEDDAYSAPGVYHVEGEDYYAGHPNPTRGNSTSEFAAAVESGLHNPVECDFISPANETSPSAPLEFYGPTPQGMDVYTASNFDSALKGDLLLAMWNSGDVERVKLNPAGTEATGSDPIFQNIGVNPLDVHAQGDDDKFPGTVWAATYGSNTITVFEPNDYGGGDVEQCTADDPTSPEYDPDGDADNDGYTNEDENTVGTNPCSQASQPVDGDQDGSPDSLDPDDDNDGLSDGEDPFAIDPLNGLDNDLPVERQFVAGQHPESLFGVGFTGLMTNGTDYADLYNGSQVRAGGATERISIDAIPFGDAYEEQNSQSYAFQYGVNATGDSPFTVRTTVESPFPDGVSPEPNQSVGMQIGPGDQDNYIKLVATAQDATGSASGGVQLLHEVNGTVVNSRAVLSESEVIGSGQTIDLYLDVYPSNDTVEASYSINGGERVYFDQTLTMSESWYATSTRGLAVGVISTARGASSTHPASWDRLSVTEITPNTAPTADAGDDQSVDEGATVVLDASNTTDPDEGDVVTYVWEQIDGPSVTLESSMAVNASFTAPDVDQNTTLTFQVEATDGTDTDTDTVNVTVVPVNEPPVADAGPDVTVAPGETIQLDGTGSSDPTDETLTYSWDQIGGPSVGVLSDNESATPTLAVTETDETISGVIELTVSDGTSSDTDSVNVTVEPTTNETVVYRINTGGDAYTDELGNQWAADDYFNTPGYVADAEAKYGTTDIAGTADDRLYLTERFWTDTTGTEYSLPVEDGNYTVRLHLAEIYFGSQSSTGDGGRVMSANLEGEPVELTGYDIHADVGPNTATVKEYTVEVTDGSLDIDFNASADNPKISAIEVLSADDDANTAPSIEPITDQTIVEGDSTDLSVSASDADGDDTLSLSLSQAPEFVSLTDNGDRTGTITIAPGAGDNGTYTVEVVADDGTVSTSETFSVDVTTTTTNEAVVYRINTGGDAYTDELGNQWAADDYFNTPGYVADAEAKYGTTDIAGTADDRLYLTERFWTDTTGTEYSLPIEDGNYTVRLHLAEIYFGSQSSTGDGGRVMSANLEGEPVELTGYDIHADVGPNTATVKEYTVEVTDGSLDIDFNASADNPKISAIEVLSADDDANTAPSIEPIADQTIVEGDSTGVSVTASDADGDDTLSLSLSQAPEFVSLTDNGDGTGTIAISPGVGDNGTYTVEVVADDGTVSTSETFSVDVTTTTTNEAVVYRINTGGDAYTDELGNQWAADDYFNAPGYVADAEAKYGTTDIAGTADDRLYLTERFWTNTTGTEYSLPVEDGNYTVRLHLAEIYFGSQSSTGDGGRVMSANLEGEPVELTGYDIHADVGPNTATVKEYTVEVTDGSLDIDFNASADNPKISAIEVLSAEA